MPAYTRESPMFKCVDSWRTYNFTATHASDGAHFLAQGYREKETTDELVTRLRGLGLKVVTYRRFVAIGHRL